ncbi:hypothetical protein PVL29_014951 [Vitis rotundifolia]|uniref:non-specific serine/threonine protein kinase n=1 Tax=Vitis rotundifolia TaxID=103349 RepID=A0AA38ZJG5_VITRO|nr:hypothetical protein PVL29_014951 [Vitis rotundifolia]
MLMERLFMGSLVGVLLLNSCLFISSSNFTDLSALLAFKSEIELDPNNILGSNWTDTENFCNWVGVSCSTSRQRVTALRKALFLLTLVILPSLCLIFVTTVFTAIYVPPSIQHCQKLEVICLAGNEFTGVIPQWLSNLTSLGDIILGQNNLTGTIPPSLGKISELPCGKQTHWVCNFQYLLPTRKFLVENSLSGTLPSTLGLWLPNLEELGLGKNKLSGVIPLYLSNCSKLVYLDLAVNLFTGEVPKNIGHLEQLRTLGLEENQLMGPIPKGIGSLTNLNLLSLSNNNPSGAIPSTIKAWKSLQRLYLDGNQPEESIPNEICLLRNLGEMGLGNNKLSGSFPSCIGNLSNLRIIFLWNLEDLWFLNLSFNSLGGSLHANMRALKMLQTMDLSWNRISGNIPTILGAFGSLSCLNLSTLCGQPIFQVPPCQSHITQKSKNKTLFKIFLPCIASVPILVALVLMMIKYRQSKVETLNTVDVAPAVEHRMISYQELRHATNDFSEANILGVGSFGSVFKGLLSEGTLVAVKVLNLQLEGAFKSFDAECKVLARVRHRNLVKVITSCSNPELRALVLQYMPNGSLEKWLYSFNYSLSLFQRVSIMLDVALALEYLHHGQSEPVVHCDLKPSNVLLDDEMVAHVGDFGIAKILAENKTVTQTKTLGTLGYIAPEYGLEGRVSSRGDIYSYGIMLLEMVTRKKPMDEMFSEEMSLRQWVQATIPNKIMEVVDENLPRN